MRFFYTFDRWGFDWGRFQVRAYWEARERPRVENDGWCWYVFAGPFMVSNHRGRILP